MIIAKRFHPKHFIALCVLTCAYMLASCTLEDPSYGEYVDNNGEYLTCKNISAIIFNDATITQDNPIYQGKDYTPAFKFHMCPNAAPNCIADTAQTNMCATKCSNLCYGECVAEYRDINIFNCDHPDGKTIACVEGFADCDGKITNGCEYHLTANHVSECQWDASSNTIEILCTDGWADCDGDPVNGCEYDLVTNHAQACANMRVTCLDDAVFSDCDGNYKNGCEYGMAGKNILSCQQRQVICQNGFGDCDGSYNNGCEIDLLSNATHCGQCTTYTVDADGIKTLDQDNNHACRDGQVCNGQGLCDATCKEGSIPCGGACLNFASNHIDIHAGGCENTRDENTNTVRTIVHCVANYANCDDDPQNGCEFGLLINNAHACEHQIVTCQDGFADCDGNYKNGCEFQLSTHHATACTREEKDGIAQITLTCAEDYVDCDGDYENGCEFPLTINNAIACQHVPNDTTGETSVLTCMDEWTDCDGNYTNGCEYNLKTYHVSKCEYNSEYCTTNDCSKEPHIQKRGRLTCDTPHADVDHDYRTGCEVDGSYDRQHCGAQGSADGEDPKEENYKGRACENDEICQDGICGFSCDESAGNTLCRRNDGSGVCLNFKALHLKDCEHCMDDYCDWNNNIYNGCEINLLQLDELKAKAIKLTPSTIPILKFLLNAAGLTEEDIPFTLNEDGCFICPPGWVPDETHTLCDHCPTGHYSKKGTRCIACTSGSYLKDNACHYCQKGTYAEKDASESCTPCPPGTYAPSIGASECAPCSANTYSNHPEGAESCTLCAAGTFSKAGSDSCSPCPAGTVSVTGGGCYPCQAGFYANDDHTECLLCKKGYISSAAGSATCTPCPTGTTNNNDHTECI